MGNKLCGDQFNTLNQRLLKKVKVVLDCMRLTCLESPLQHGISRFRFRQVARWSFTCFQATCPFLNQSVLELVTSAHNRTRLMAEHPLSCTMPTLLQGTLLAGNTIVFPLASQLANAILLQCCRQRSNDMSVSCCTM